MSTKSGTAHCHQHGISQVMNAVLRHLLQCVPQMAETDTWAGEALSLGIQGWWWISELRVENEVGPKLLGYLWKNKRKIKANILPQLPNPATVQTNGHVLMFEGHLFAYTYMVNIVFLIVSHFFELSWSFNLTSNVYFFQFSFVCIHMCACRYICPCVHMWRTEIDLDLE